jgi:hypothetical protein
MLKCKNGHELIKGARFREECGVKIEDGVTSEAKGNVLTGSINRMLTPGKLSWPAVGSGIAVACAAAWFAVPWWAFIGALCVLWIAGGVVAAQRTMRPMKPSEKASLVAFGIGIATGSSLAWFLPGYPWWAYVSCGAIAMGGAYRGALEIAALKKIANLPSPD